MARPKEDNGFYKERDHDDCYERIRVYQIATPGVGVVMSRFQSRVMPLGLLSLLLGLASCLTSSKVRQRCMKQI